MTQQPMLLAQIVWMEDYQGFENTPTFKEFLDDNDFDYIYEMINFEPINGRCYGYAEVSPHERNGKKTYPKLKIEKLGADKNANVVEGVLVVFIAKKPENSSQTVSGKKVVGWYRNASVYRERQIPDGDVAKSRTYKTRYGEEEVFAYWFSAKEEDCVLLPNERRELTVPCNGPKDCPGRFSFFYPDPVNKPDFKEKEKEIRNFIKKYDSNGEKTKGKET